jgi:hypothetical protein
MTITRRTLTKLALVLALGPATGCTFGWLPRESRDPALAAVPPCFTGDICGVPFDGAGVAWVPDALRSAGR